MVSNCLKCTAVSTSMDQSREKIQSLSEQSFKKEEEFHVQIWDSQHIMTRVQI